jgi:isopenicillin-N epimerase
VQDYLHSERIECPVKTVNGRLYVRISAAVYNELEDYEHLGQAVRGADWSAVLA